MMKHILLIITLSLTLLPRPAFAAQADGTPRAAKRLSRRPAIEGLRVSNDRWPDAFSLRSFAEDAIRLQRARTEEEEALALYDWIARVMTIGGSPFEGPRGKERFVLDTLKILNVYGNHWCDGQARLYETMWRSLGRQASRLYIPMRHHTFVELWWKDTDGQGRWHALDVNNGWFVRNAAGWIASCEDIERNPFLVLAANQELKMGTKGWLRTHFTPMPEHSMALHLRRSESYSLLWDNGGIYYVNPKTRASISADNLLFESGGVYSEFIGGSELIFAPDLSSATWTDDLWEEPKNTKLVAGRISPAVAGQVASFTYQFDFPYLIADAGIEATVGFDSVDSKGDPQSTATISFSTDGGKSWNPVWNTTKSGQQRLKLAMGRERDRSGLSSVCGLYSYLVRFDAQAQSDPARIAFADLKFTHRAMMNKMTLPNLQPGWNRFKIAAETMQPGHALKVILEWSDKDGRQRAERVAERLPFFLDVFANGSGGSAVKMRALRLEVVTPGGLAEAARLSPVERLKSSAGDDRIKAIIEAGLSKQAAAVRPLIEILQSEDQELRYWAADALGKLGDAQAVPALIAALRDPYEAVRMSASVALGDLKSKEAVPALSELVSGKVPTGKGYRLFVPVDVGAARWMAAEALGRIGGEGAVDVLAATILEGDGDLGWYVARALAELGDRRAVPALIEASRKGTEPALRGMVEALGSLGDTRAVPVLLDLLQTGKEEVRHAAAIALGRLRDPGSTVALKKASESDPLGYVREAAARALEEISKNQ